MKAKIKKMARAARKSAEKIVTKSDVIMAASAAVVSMGLSMPDSEAMQAAYADMADEFGADNAHATIIDMNPFDGLIA